MKKLLIISSILFTSISNLNAQAYWACLNMQVDPEGQEQVVEAIENLMGSELFSQAPWSVTLNEVQFNSKIGNLEVTHQLCFLGESSDAFAFWGQGPPPSVEGIMLFNALNKYVDFEQSILGSPLIFDPNNLNSNFAGVWGINVKDPLTYAKEFVKLKNFVDSIDSSGTFELHEAILGAQPGVTHYFVARSENLKSWLDSRNQIVNSKAFQSFFANTREVSETLFNFGARIVKRYNMD